MTGLVVLGVLAVAAVVAGLDQWGDRIWWSAVLAVGAHTALAGLVLTTPTSAGITLLVSTLTTAAGLALVAAEAAGRGIPLTVALPAHTTTERR